MVILAAVVVIVMVVGGCGDGKGCGDGGCDNVFEGSVDSCGCEGV